MVLPLLPRSLSSTILLLLLMLSMLLRCYGDIVVWMTRMRRTARLLVFQSVSNMLHIRCCISYRLLSIIVSSKHLTHTGAIPTAHILDSSSTSTFSSSFTKTLGHNIQLIPSVHRAIIKFYVDYSKNMIQLVLRYLHRKEETIGFCLHRTMMRSHSRRR